MQSTVRHLKNEISLVRIESSYNEPILGIRELWQYRELLDLLVWREIKIRYKQTAIGVSWAVLQPFLTMVIFAVIFGSFAQIPSDGLPYPVFAYTALLPWTYFSQAVGRSSHCLVGDASLLQKVYFPRLILPLTAVIVPLVDFLFAFLVFLGMIVWFDVALTWKFLMLPLFLFMAFLTALGIGLWLAPLNVKYRDVRIVIPVIIQLWMYASPIVYPLSLIPEKWRFLYSLNPLVGVIDGFRWALVGHAKPDFELMAVSAVAIMFLLWLGLYFFKRAEPTFADFV